ncbi:MAG: serine hydrolase [Caldilineaceae bacterium]|nr:serine hydrolase [Caldilineaceae bacterium]
MSNSVAPHTDAPNSAAPNSTALSQFDFPRTTPEAQGISSRAVMDFLSAIAADELELHSLMLLRHGHVVAEGWWAPYARNRIHLLYSLSKSFTSTAVGLAVAEGRLTIDDPVVSFFPEAAPDVVSDELAALRVRHLLSMGTGHVEDTTERMMARGGEDWVKGFLATPPDQAPGSIFTYNNGATFMLAAILHKLTGMSLVDYLQPRLFGPLGISQLFWQQNPQGINLGYSGLHLTTDAIARLGQLYLQNGQWQGVQLIAPEWVNAATTRQIGSNSPGGDPEGLSVDWAQGYGYQFWRCRHNAYRGDGAFSQFCVVMPDQDAVLAITSGTDKMQAVLDHVWTHLLPAMGPAAQPADPETHGQLVAQLGALAYPPLSGRPTSPIAQRVAGQSFIFSAEIPADATGDLPHVVGATLTFASGNEPGANEVDGCTLMLEDASGTHALHAGFGIWRESTTTFYGGPDAISSPTVGSFAWSGDDTLTLQVRYIETPHSLTVTCRFVDDTLEMGMRLNVSFGPVELPTLTGRRAT